MILCICHFHSRESSRNVSLVFIHQGSAGVRSVSLFLPIGTGEDVEFTKKITKCSLLWGFIFILHLLTSVFQSHMGSICCVLSSVNLYSPKYKFSVFITSPLNLSPIQTPVCCFNLIMCKIKKNEPW